MDQLYNNVSFNCSKIITQQYSTSFSIGIKTLHKSLRNPIYGIYGFVRLADEIVDTFHDQDKERLLHEYRTETFKAIDQQIHLNPVLNAFQSVVRRYDIPNELIESFLDSMEMDLHQTAYDRELFEKYLYGSAEVVGLMCLKVFCDGDDQLYDSLHTYAQSLGAAFQKINFLRDIQSDIEDRGRVYFPGLDFKRFSEKDKANIEREIRLELDHALVGIRKLPKSARTGVYLSYIYYAALFQKIRKLPASQIMRVRVRVHDAVKMRLLAFTYLKSAFYII